MRQLVHRHRRARRAVVTEELAVDLVVAAEVVHVDEKRHDLDDVGKRCAGGREDVARGCRSRARVCARMSSRVVPIASTAAPAIELSGWRELRPETKM